MNNSKSNYEKSVELLKVLMTDLSPSISVPSDTIGSLHPFDQYERALQRKDQLWCTNIASMFVYISNCFQIPSRFVATGKSISNRDIYLYTHDGHTTTEIYDNKTSKWVWMDVGYGIIGVSDFKDHYLDVTQLCYAMNDPTALDNLIVHLFKDGKLKKVKFNDYAEKSSLINYFGRSQDVFYYHKEKFPIQFPIRIEKNGSR